MSRVAIITGITGQDGAYLAKLLSEMGYSVIGLIRSYHTINTKGLDYLDVSKNIILEECDLADLSQVLAVIKQYSPDEIHNLAAQSSVSLSFKPLIGTIQYNVVSVLNILEAIRMINPEIRFYQASSSEVFGHSELPIRETTHINPISPYSISKATAHWITKNYRDSYGLFSCSGFLFNHESHLRSDNFLVKKVILQALKSGEDWPKHLKWEILT
jgi:GDPmannose 4,6-dehydratase